MTTTANAGTIIVAHDRTDTQGVADSVVHYLRQDHGYEVLVVGPGQGRLFEQLTPSEIARARFFLELDAVSGLLYHTEGLERLRIPKLAWFVDSHKKPHLHHRIAPDFDLVFYTMWAWGHLFDEKARWLPVHFDPAFFQRRDDVEPRYDIGFVGSQPHERTRIVQDIAARHGLSLLLETTTGPTEKEQTAALYAQCKVVFNRHVSNDFNFRMVEALACGRLLVTDAQRNGQYELFEDREHVVYYKDDRDLEDLLLYYLRNREDRERVARSGHDLAHVAHTTPTRVREIVEAAEQLSEPRSAPIFIRSTTRGGPSVADLSRQRILLIGSELSFAAGPGRGRTIGNVALDLAALGAHVEVVTAHENQAACRDGIVIHTASAPSGPPPHHSSTASVMATTQLLDRAVTAVRAQSTPFDLLLVVGWEDAITARTLERRFQLPYVLLLDGTEVGRRQNQLVRETHYVAEMEDWAVEGACAVVATSDSVRDETLRFYGKPPEKVHVLVARIRPAATRCPELLDRLTLTQGDSLYLISTDRGSEISCPAAGRWVSLGPTHPPEALVLSSPGSLIREQLLQSATMLVLDHTAATANDVTDALAAGSAIVARRGTVAASVLEQAGRPDWVFETPEELRPSIIAARSSDDDERQRVLESVSSVGLPLGKIIERVINTEKARRRSQTIAQPVGDDTPRCPDDSAPNMPEQLARDCRYATDIKPPDVSIRLICGGREDTLRQTLETTRAALATFPGEIEWIAFDNGTSAAVRTLIDNAKLDHVIRAPSNVGLAPALDSLYAKCRGQYILTLEDDWECLASDHLWLDRAIAVLQSMREVGLVRLRKVNDNQTAHFDNHRPDVALRHHPWTVRPLPEVVETHDVANGSVFVVPAEYANWTHNPTLCRREVLEWLGPMSSYLPDARDHRPSATSRGLEGEIDHRRWRDGPWRVAKLVDGPFSHLGLQCSPLPAGVDVS